MILSDNELAAYNRGRRDEYNATLKVLEMMRVFGYLSVDECNRLIDYLAVVDRRPVNG